MIRFIKDYTTKALPPEHFSVNQEVANRSAESELYFVRLGVAGYVVEGQLVDQDYLPINLTPAVVLVASDRRFGDVGRAGEVIGLDAPQRASTGPGNAAMFGTDVSTGLSQVEFDQLRSDLAASASQFDEYRSTSQTEVERLTAELDEASGAVDVAIASRDQATSQLALQQADLVAAREEAATLQGKLDAAQGQIVDLQTQLDRATAPVPPDNQGMIATKPAKTSVGK